MISEGLRFDQITILSLHILVRQAGANSVDPDQMPHNVPSDQGLHCFSLTQQFHT